jgi:hypothetical protein
MTVCRSCGAEVIWAETATGKRIPMDPGPVPLEQRGALVLVEAGARNYVYGLADLTQTLAFAEGVSETRARELIDERYEALVSHFSSCPEADQHRRSRP